MHPHARMLLPSCPYPCDKCHDGQNLELACHEGRRREFMGSVLVLLLLMLSKARAATTTTIGVPKTITPMQQQQQQRSGQRQRSGQPQQQPLLILLVLLIELLLGPCSTKPVVLSKDLVSRLLNSFRGTGMCKFAGLVEVREVLVVIRRDRCKGLLPVTTPQDCNTLAVKQGHFGDAVTCLLLQSQIAGKVV